jgi:hypothetical protein
MLQLPPPVPGGPPVPVRCGAAPRLALYLGRRPPHSRDVAVDVSSLWSISLGMLPDPRRGLSLPSWF